LAVAGGLQHHNRNAPQQQHNDSPKSMARGFFIAPKAAGRSWIAKKILDLALVQFLRHVLPEKVQ
jgi:hypothetical protein